MTGYYHKHCGVITHLLADVAYTTLVLSKFEIQKCLHTYMYAHVVIHKIFVQH